MTTTPPTQARPNSDSATTASDPPRGTSGRGNASGRPRMAVATGAATDHDVAIRALREFHVGASEGAATPAAGTLPALLHPYRDAARLRTDYPVYIHVDDDLLVCRPVSEQLAVWAEAVKVGGRVLTDNLDRVERRIRDALGSEARPHAAHDVLEGACAGVYADLGLTGETAEALRSGLDALLAQVAEGAVLQGFGEGAALSLAIASARATVPLRRRQLAETARVLCQRLRSLLAVERSKDPSARDPNAIASSLAGSNLQIDAAALSQVLGDHRGTARANPARRERLAGALDVLEAYLAKAESAPVITFVCRGETRVPSMDAEDVRVVDHADPSSGAVEEFDKAAAEMASLLRAIRLARLELDDSYEPAIHDAWLERLSWSGFTAEELRTVTPVFAIEEASRLSSDGLRGLSRLLRSGKPAKVLVDVLPAADPDIDATLGDAVRFELGYFAISHREALVHQSAAARPAHLVSGLRKALDATRPAMHVLATPHEIAGGLSTVGGWLHTGAAVDGRAHPLFCYDPEPGVSWARRFELSGNPEADADWPTGALPHVGTDGAPATLELAFTFADFALLEPSYDKHFAQVPPGVSEEDLAPVADWLRLDPTDAAARVPFVWGVDPAGTLSRLAITRELAFASRDRQRYWRTLQEWAGVHNEHVERAVAGALEAAEAKHRAELERLEREGTEQVERVRSEAAGEAMQRLAAALLDADLDMLGSVGPATSRPVKTPAAAAPIATEPEPVAAAAPVPAAAAPAALSLSFDEPSIDSALCTSCNDCLAINSVMFVYDENKQARIGDASSGSFEQLVRAAESCPAKCIHPGKPQDPSEPNLDALIARAAEFN